METKIFKTKSEYRKSLKKSKNVIYNGVSQEFLDKHNITLREYSILNESNDCCWNGWNCKNCYECNNCENCRNCFRCNNLKDCKECKKCAD